MAIAMTPERRVNILRNMTSNRQIPFQDAAVPVDKFEQGTGPSNPVYPSPIAQPMFTRPAQGQPVYGGGYNRQRPQTAAAPIAQGQFTSLQDLMQQFMPFQNPQAWPQQGGFGMQNAAAMQERAMEQFGQYQNRVPLFAGNFASNLDQMRAAQQGAMPRPQGRARPFANYYQGARQGRGGLQPVASAEDASRRQQMQQIATPLQRNTSNEAGNVRGRTLQRRRVF